LALLALASTGLILTFVTVGQAARKPTLRERAAIEQAIFDDYLHSKTSAAHAVITAIRVSTRAAPRPRGKAKGYYDAFARVDLFDSAASGPGTAILGYRVERLPGWRVLDLGSVEVGCQLSASIFRGRRGAVLRDLDFDCPSTGTAAASTGRFCDPPRGPGDSAVHSRNLRVTGITCATGRRVALSCHRFSYGHAGTCLAGGYRWRCTSTNPPGSESAERCSSGRRLMSIRWTD
jgi:hypothetical protein